MRISIVNTRGRVGEPFVLPTCVRTSRNLVISFHDFDVNSLSVRVIRVHFELYSHDTMVEYIKDRRGLANEHQDSSPVQ